MRAGAAECCSVQRLPPQFRPEMLALAEVGEPCAHVIGQVGGEPGEGCFGNEQAFDGNPFGIDDFVLIEDEGEVVGEAATAEIDGIVVDQVTGLNKDFGRANAPGAALIEKHAVMLADNQVADVAKRACGDHDRGEGAESAERGAANPTQGLGAVIAGQDQIAGLQGFNGAGAACGQGDAGAATEGQAEEIGELGRAGGGVDAEKGIVAGGGDGGKGKGEEGALGAELEEEEIHAGPVVSHQCIAGGSGEGLPGFACVGAMGDALGGPLAFDDKAKGGGGRVEFIDVARADRVGQIERITGIDAGGDKNILCVKDHAGLGGVGGGDRGGYLGHRMLRSCRDL